MRTKCGSGTQKRKFDLEMTGSERDLKALITKSNQTIQTDNMVRLPDPVPKSRCSSLKCH